MKLKEIKNFVNIPFKRRKSCLICTDEAGESLINWPDFPMTEIYIDRRIKEKAGFVDQSFYFCKRCGHGQILNVVDPQLQYGDPASYHFRASESATGRETADFFIAFLNSVTGRKYFKNIIEIGCNDLYVLKALKSKAKELIGIDPILKGRETDDSLPNNITAIGDFFEKVVFKEEFDLVICKDTLEHIDNPKQFIKKIIDKSHNETLFFFQFPLLDMLFAECRFDQIFHQHLNYFSFKSINYIFDELGCRLLDYKINMNHWGSILVAFKKGRNNGEFLKAAPEISGSEIIRRYELFKNNMLLTSRYLSLLSKETIYGYGAALTLPVLSYHLGNDLSCLKYIVDDDKNKQGLYYINLPLSIQTAESIEDIRNSVILITAISSISNLRRILHKLIKLDPKQIIVPLKII